MKNRIQRFAKFFRVIFFIVLVFSPVIMSGIWISGGSIPMGDEHSETVVSLLADDIPQEGMALSFPLPWDTRLAGLAVSMIPTSISMLSMWWLVCLFGCFSAGEIFSAATVGYIRRLGWTMGTSAIAGPIYQTLLVLVLTMHNPVGERLLIIGLKSGEVEKLLIAGIIILVSWIMEEGRKLREAEDLTI